MFRRVLIANRGEIALRIIRSLRELGVESVVIHGREDRLSLPVRLADEGYFIPRDDPLATYLDIEAIVSAAKEVGADAVHPGYGFLSENPTFAKRLSEEGITFIGPSEECLRLLGDKIAARKSMSEAGIPIARGTEKPVSDYQEALGVATEIGFPIMIKAASGRDFKSGKNFRVILTTPAKLMFITLSQSAGGISSKSDITVMPALLKTRSTAWCRAITSSCKRSICKGSAMSTR